MLYDLSLLEQLNEEYRDRPIIDLPALAKRRQLLSSHIVTSPARDQATITSAERQQYAADGQLKSVLHDVDLTGKVVLELGCGQGWLTSVLPDQAGVTRAYGVDIERYSSWTEHTDPRVKLIEADLSRKLVVPLGSIDTVISNVTFEHVTRPLEMLSAVHEVLKDGGEAWIRTNVYTARNASHRYAEIFFPWPHLLFEDEVCEQFYQKHHGKAGPSFSWVNKMTVAHYVHAAREVGFEITLARRRVVPIDIPFYLRFIEKLGRFVALDLETDFLTLVLSKTQVDLTKPPERSLDLDYTARQVQLNRRVHRYKKAERERAATAPAPVEPVEPGVAADHAPDAKATDSGAVENINTPTYWDGRYQKEWESGKVFSNNYARDYGLVHDAMIALMPDGAHVLDVACGAGVLCRKIKARLPETVVTGVDFSPYTIEQNQRADEHPENSYLCLDVQTELPSLNQQYDVITMAEIIEHLDDAERAIGDAVGLLKPGGRLIITCPHDDAIPSKEHVRQFGHDRLFHLLTAHTDTVCFTQFPPSHAKWMMAYFVKSKQPRLR